MLKIILNFLFLINLIYCENYKDVRIQEGIVRGRKQVSYHGTTYYSFEGIPYAKPPIGYLRFQPPEPVEKWDGILEAFDSRIVCPQGGRENNETENCLILNVYTPKVDPKNLKAVYFYTYGGGYVIGSIGSDTTSSEYLMAHDIVVVTLNYRLGLLGFLRFNDPKLNMFGNNGMRDNILALKWVQRNIAKFGGDPNRVTVGGCSSGGRTVHALMFSPLARGLFHRGIMESGTAMYKLHKISALEIAQHWRPEIKTETEAFKLFNSSTADELFQMITTMVPMGYGSIDIEVDPESPEPFLPKSHLEIIKNREYNNISVLYGYNSEEAIEMWALASQPTEVWFDKKEYMISSILNIKKKELYPKYLEAMTKYYLDNPNYTKLQSFLKLFMELFFLMPIVDATDLHFSRMENNNYFYRISLDTKLNYLKYREHIHHIPGTSHADELGYIFHMHVNERFEKGTPEEIGADILLTLWTNFIKTGDPNLPDTKIFDENPQNDHWQPIKKNFTKRFRNLNIGFDLKMKNDILERERINFWLDLRKYGPERFLKN